LSRGELEEVLRKACGDEAERKAREPMSTGTITPKRSAIFPIRMPPKPNPIIVSV